MDQKTLKSIVYYHPDTGIFTWKMRAARNVRIGDVAGSKNAGGYVLLRVKGNVHYAHRLAWLYVTGAWPAQELDHINGIKDDNSFLNLRLATKSENQRNKGKQRNNTSGFKGVSFYKRRHKWQATIRVDGQPKHLGYFQTPEAAHKAYCAAAETYHGNFSKL